MAKTQEELKELKTEYETLNSKLKELSEDELLLVTGGGVRLYDSICPYHNIMNYYECNRPLKSTELSCLYLCKNLADGRKLPAKHDVPEKDSYE